jgi:hypothetical protein
MKRTKNIFALIGTVFICLILLNININAQASLLVNEVLIDPPNPTVVSDRCQYVELRGTPGATVPANTYFISINSDPGNFGFLNVAVNVSGQVVGANGTITLINTLGGVCPNRTYNAGTTIFNYSSLTTLGKGSEGFYIVTSATALAAGQDLDTNDDGALNFTINFVDGFNLIFNPDEHYAYGPGANLVEVLLGDVPDAVTRFANNNTPFAAAAFYSGELASSTEETLTYVAPFSANFPAGAMLTPGAPNGAVVPQGTARADFDGDGRTDLSVFRPTEGNWYLNRSTAGFNVINWGLSSDEIVPGDYDGDGKADTAVKRGNTWYVLNSGNFSVTTVQYGLAGDIAAQADYDGDDRTDITVFRPSNGTWYARLSSNGTTAFIPFGTNGDVPVAADYDGDGTDDQAVYRNGTWYLRQSTAGVSIIPFGLASDLPVQADYDGDGRDDLAVFRPSNGTWYARLSSNGSTAFIPFGTSGDVPVPGDYDGDGRDDQAVYRNGVWYILQSTSGVSIQTFGLAADQPVPNGYIP